MELFDNLASIGLTPLVLQGIIIGGVILFLIGMFWRFILAGMAVMFCVAVFAMPNKKVEKPVEVKPTENIQQVTPVPEAKTLKPNEEIIEVVPEVDTSEKGMFMTDCQKYGGYTSAQCMALWNDRENDKVRFRSATNKMFMLKAKYRYNI